MFRDRAEVVAIGAVGGEDIVAQSRDLVQSSQNLGVCIDADRFLSVRV